MNTQRQIAGNRSTSYRWTINIRHDDVEWARGWLEPTITTLLGYVIKRNLSYGIDEYVVDVAEVYAVLRQTYGKRQIERLWNAQINVT